MNGELDYLSPTHHSHLAKSQRRHNIKEVTIPFDVYDAMQTELHDLRQLIGKIADEQELAQRSGRYGLHYRDSFFDQVEEWIAKYRQRDYRTWDGWPEGRNNQ